jgi:hypothetical protein
VLEGLALESFTRMNQRRPPQSTSNPSELAVFRKSCDGERLVGYVPQGHWKTITDVAALRRHGIIFGSS